MAAEQKEVSTDLIEVIDAGIKGWEAFDAIRHDGKDKLFQNVLRFSLELVPAVKLAVDNAEVVPQALLNAVKSPAQIEEILAHIEEKVGKPDSRIGKLVRKGASLAGSLSAAVRDGKALLEEFKSGKQSLSADVLVAPAAAGGQEQGQSGVKAGGDGLTADVAARFAEQQKTHK